MKRLWAGLAKGSPEKKYKNGKLSGQDASGPSPDQPGVTRDCFVPLMIPKVASAFTLDLVRLLKKDTPGPTLFTARPLVLHLLVQYCEYPPAYLLPLLLSQHLQQQLRIHTIRERRYKQASMKRPRCTTGRKKLVQDPTCCPVCGVTVRGGELESHFLQELDRLFKMAPAARQRRQQHHGPPQGHAPPRPGNIGSTADGTAEGRWETYQRIKANRTSRLRIKNRKRKADEATCPVCNERFQGSVEELNLHVEHCLRKNGGVPEEDENVDVEGDGETFEEYEWAGQKRIRASTLLQGGYAGAGMVTASRAGGGEEDDGELVVDGDETATYGPPQYSEADVVPPSACGAEDSEREALREAPRRPRPRHPEGGVLGVGQRGRGRARRGRRGQGQGRRGGGGGRAGAQDDQPSMTPPAEGGAEGAPSNPTLEALKRRIRELELESKAATVDKLKCLICMERYKKPAISICCWHVHCEQCWLHTLGAKKLCPQCNMITSPSDLRRIYL
ncbi:LOW QUALITY PROTEIN: E3 ubiquitin-protein ligase Rnf220 [Frankliniella fusca]|uniref:E3 ubiquitin-protein ligase Rnf220 n=1 Tax=Frankliniella fusca TaxID=407009 RepID=A0AAE1LS31_9NEOP|nr:LOW QUALITY PROTEIN: E3 ubiquitin-protein ligase Rnf220 [Frankliniella fusca]